MSSKKYILLLLIALLPLAMMAKKTPSAFERVKAEIEGKNGAASSKKSSQNKVSQKEKEKARKQKQKERKNAQKEKRKQQKQKIKDKKERSKEKKYTVKQEPVRRLDPNTPKDTTLMNVYMLNSPMNDYQPFNIGKFMVYTSDRYRKPETKPEEFTEKAYFAKRKGEKRWQAPEQNGYKWNSDNNTSLVGIDDENFYFYRCYWPDNGEIFYSSRITDKQRRRTDKKNPWKVQRLHKFTAIDSEYDETSVASINKDSILFVSNRSGNYDIYMLLRGSVIKPMDILNSPYDDNDLYFEKQDRAIYFASDRPGGFGGYDIYRSVVGPDGEFSKPELVMDTVINTPYDERDFHKDCDSVMFFSSNREGGVGNLDIYQLTISTLTPEIIDTTKTEEEQEEDEIDRRRSELMQKLKEYGLLPFHGEVQIGAYQYIKSVKDFYKRFPCIKEQDIKMQEILVDGKFHVHKFIINKVYTIVDEALDKQYEIEKMHCLPDKEFSDMPFIGVLDKEGNRFAIFWKKDEFVQKNIYYIFKNGKIVWKSRKF